MGFCDYVRIPTNGQDIWPGRSESKSWLCYKYTWKKATENGKGLTFHSDASLWLGYTLFPLQTGTLFAALKERATIWFCNVKTIIALRKRITELSVPSVYAFNKHSVSKRIECLFVLWCFSTTTSEFLYLNVWETCFYKFTETWQTVGIFVLCPVEMGKSLKSLLIACLPLCWEPGASLF